MQLCGSFSSFTTWYSSRHTIQMKIYRIKWTNSLPIIEHFIIRLSCKEFTSVIRFSTKSQRSKRPAWLAQRVSFHILFECLFMAIRGLGSYLTATWNELHNSHLYCWYIKNKPGKITQFQGSREGDGMFSFPYGETHNVTFSTGNFKQLSAKYLISLFFQFMGMCLSGIKSFCQIL